ncbi:MAG: TIM-barrel domain-containing protein [Bacillota bacterium]
MMYFTSDQTALYFRNLGETLELRAWGKNSLRVRAVMMGEPADDRWALLEPEETKPEIIMEDNRARIRNGKLTAEVVVEGWHGYASITYFNQDGQVLLRETGHSGALSLRARAFEPLAGGDFALTVRFDGEENEHLYGMGQYQQETLDLKHCVLEMAHRNSQASVPFVMSSRGYGFLWHNPAVGEATFGKNYTLWKAACTRQMDYWITAGGSPAEISLAYANATGFAPMMPEYGLGFWQCKLRYWNQEQLLEIAREHRRRGLPMDVIVCDFFHWPKMGDYRFDPEFFPDPKAMADELEAMGIKLMVSVWPQVSLESENYQEMRRQGLLVRAEHGEQIGMRFQGDSMFYDATNPRARSFVWDKCRQNYYDQGVSLFWLDEAEPEYGTYDYDNYRYWLGSALRVGNIYPQMFARNFYEGMRESGTELPVNLLRCAWAGSQRYGALVWSGDIHSDWETLRRQVCAGLSMGVAGIPWWTTDIGGFMGGNPDDPAFRELFIRWFQWGAYCPVMRLHGDRIPYQSVTRADGTAIQGTGGPNEIWSYGEEAYPVLVKYLHLREQMRDYIRETMQETHETGKPVMRPMFYEFPEDETCAALRDQYLFGGKYLVAPVMQPGQRSRKVYLPKGAWRNVNTGETLAGGRWTEAPAPLDTIPVFERS